MEIWRIHKPLEWSILASFSSLCACVNWKNNLSVLFHIESDELTSGIGNLYIQFRRFARAFFNLTCARYSVLPNFCVKLFSSSLISDVSRATSQVIHSRAPAVTWCEKSCSAERARHRGWTEIPANLISNYFFFYSSFFLYTNEKNWKLEQINFPKRSWALRDEKFLLRKKMCVLKLANIKTNFQLYPYSAEFLSFSSQNVCTFPHTSHNFTIMSGLKKSRWELFFHKFPETFPNFCWISSDILCFLMADVDWSESSVSNNIRVPFFPPASFPSHHKRIWHVMCNQVRIFKAQLMLNECENCDENPGYGEAHISAPCQSEHQQNPIKVN